MAQVNFPIMVNLDWLEISLRSTELTNLDRSDTRFVFHLRERGTTQYKTAFDIEYFSTDGEIMPFGVFLCEPTLASWSPSICNLKLANSILYAAGDDRWSNVLRSFLESYNLFCDHIVRADLAGDFLYLNGRVSGAQLAQKIKTFQWWKCGSVNISEHYTMPYSVKWQREVAIDGYETQIYLQGGEVTARCESMTFGKISSDAQVVLYDKSLELDLSSIEIEHDGKKVRQSKKEYIRDCWKQAGVWHQKRHTWRIEIRLRRAALFMYDSKSAEPRAVVLDDILDEHVNNTFLLAVDRYFRLVDATLGGTRPITADVCRTLHDHKNRLPIVKLFSLPDMERAMCRVRYHEPANKFHRSVITRLDQLAQRLKLTNGHLSEGSDIRDLNEGLQVLQQIECQQKDMLKLTNPVKNALESLLYALNQSGTLLSQNQEVAISKLYAVLCRHLKTESPRFTENLIRHIQKVYSKVERSYYDPGQRKFVQGLMPTDAEFLSGAASVLRSIHSSVVADQRKEDDVNIYRDALIAALSEANQNPGVDEYVFRFIRYALSDRSPISADDRQSLMEIFGTNVVKAILMATDYEQHLAHFKLND